MKWIFSLVLLIVPGMLYGIGSTGADIFRGIQESHIQGNVPEASTFDAYLKRDVASFFQAKFRKSLEISYDLLRQGPTQSGVALPKYYLWVRVIDQGTIIEEGNHEGLLQQSGHYATLYNTYFRHQSLAYIEQAKEMISK